MPFKDREQKSQYMKEYNQSPVGKKSKRISAWKGQGIIVEDWDTFHDSFIATTNCQMCQKELTTGKRSHSTKCADHNHNITDRPNVRAICCHACNTNDKLTNTSGEPNIIKDRNFWKFQKTIQGKKYCKSGFKTFQEAVDYKISILGKI